MLGVGNHVFPVFRFRSLGLAVDLEWFVLLDLDGFCLIY
jgi:hypothetical protein